METTRTTRREFLVSLTYWTAAGAAAVQLPMLASLASCADDTEHFARLTTAEARTMRAFAAQILPWESGSPGAEELRIVYFVDRAFGDPFFADAVPGIRAGLADLDMRARAVGARGGFASLSDAEQVAIMQRVARSSFFASARLMVLTGAFADPSYGGNYRGAGHMMIGMEHRPSYSAPFGWYDAHSATEHSGAT